MLTKIRHILFFTCLVPATIYAGAAVASPLTFRGQNAAIFPDAYSGNTSALMNSVPKPKAKAATTPVIDPARLIQQSLQSQISSKIYNDIFNTTSASGSYDLGGGNLISYVRVGGNIEISITNPTNGTTVITVPDV
jgi:hypothetical protein